MTYTTLTFNGVEKTLADWGVRNWNRIAQNQGDDALVLTITTPMDGADIFPYGANVIVKINRTTAAVNPVSPTLPVSGSTSFSGGTQWFWGYGVENGRVGDPTGESFTYKFVGPYQFFFERLIFQKYQLTWNGSKQIVDWQSDVILGLSLTTLTGTGDTVQSSTATNLMTLAQQIKEICMFAQNDSAYQQANNGLGWPTSSISGQPANAQFQCDQLTTNVDGVNWDLLNTPSANVLIKDYASAPQSGKTSASTLPGGSYVLRAPLDAVNAITCAEAMRRQLQWLGGVGSPVVWTDHAQTPPQLRVATRDQLSTKSLVLTGVTVRNKIKKRTDLLPAAVHFKYKVSGSYLGQPYSELFHDVATTIGGTQLEGIGQLGALVNLSGGTYSTGANNTFMAEARTATSMVQTLDFQGAKVNASSATIATLALPLASGALADPSSGSGAAAFWKQLFPELANVTNLGFFDGVNFPATVTDAVSGASISLGTYAYWLQKGSFFPWMVAGGTAANPTPGLAAKVKITAWFKHQEQAMEGSNTVNTANVGRVEKNIVLVLTNMASGTYYSAASVQVGEPIPYGLAGYIYALETIPQYEGSVLVQETEISDVCPLGNALNITGGLAEWASMKACVQSVRYQDNGQTEIIFGPARHLGPGQFVARFRNTVGPRWYNLIAGDPMNAGNTGPVSESTEPHTQAPSDGGKDFQFKSFFTGLDTVLAGGSIPTLPGGVHIDSGAAVTPFTGTVASGQLAFRIGQAVVLGAGPNGASPGESQAWIRVSLGDLQNSGSTLQNLHIYLREIPDCKTISGTPTAGYRLVLCSEFYTGSLRSTPDP